ncbi:MAG: hemerythrin domain-containing protein [Ignavibacterium sp.]
MINSELLRYKKMEMDSFTNTLIDLHKKLVDPENYNMFQNSFQSEKEVLEIVDRLFKDLKHHIYKEEKILFPYLINLSKTKRKEIPFEKPYFETVKNPVEIMKTDHEQINEDIKTLKELIENEISILDKDSDSFQKIKNFIDDVEKVIYLENEILFPNAITLENKFLALLK